jgi:hypothetical protein
MARNILVALIVCFGPSSRALLFNITYDTSVTSLGNAAQVETAFGTAVQTFESLYTNDSTVNLTVYWGNTGPFTNGISLGASETVLVGTYTYADVSNALYASSTTAADISSVASLPPTDPIANDQWIVPRAEAKALGLPGVPPHDTSDDGDIGFASNVTYTFDANDRAVPGEFDFIGVAEHEISEVLGRIAGLGQDGGIYLPYDLFRFTSNGVRSFGISDTNVYFSVDNGATVLKYFFGDITLGDIQDWQTSSPPDAFDAFASMGSQGLLSSADITAVDILGYDLNLPILILAGAKQPNGLFQLTFTNTPGTASTVLASTNLSISTSNWTVVGTTAESSAGQFQFTDTQASTNRQRFYRTRLN